MSSSNFSCENCSKLFTKKSFYDSHMNRKIPCKKNINEDYKEGNEINTFSDLFQFLKNYKDDSILNWLNDHWKGKDKQESLLRLFAHLGIIDKFKDFSICKGNFNLNTIRNIDSFKDIFFDEKNNLIYLKDSGDSSDLTGIHFKNKKHILVTTSKNLNKMNIGDLDIDKILTNFQNYKKNDYILTICICVRDKNAFYAMQKNIKKTNNALIDILNTTNLILIDWSDLDQYYHSFKKSFNNIKLTDMLNTSKIPLSLKFHQHLSVTKTIDFKNKNINKILWGHIPRSGKSYIIAGTIIDDSKLKEKSNYLIITTAPNETIEQYLKVLDCLQLITHNVIYLNGNNKKPLLKDKNIFICSKQFLQSKIDDEKTEEKCKTITWLKKIDFDIRFIDESHNGGTTELAQKTLQLYGNNSFTVQITATYTKPIQDYQIPKNNWILWDLEDIKLCKNIDDQNNLLRLIEKHGSEVTDILKHYCIENIIDEYSKYPELYLLTDEIKPEIVTEIISNTKDNNYGWSLDSCFLLKQSLKEDDEKTIIKIDEFQNENENLKLWYRIFGKYNKFNIPDKDYPDDLVFFKRIEKICKNPNINSRFFDYKNPLIIMAFLPQNDIDLISKATINLLEKYNVIPEFEIVSINSKITNNPKKTIGEAFIKAKNTNKKGVLVLSGKQCSLGVSIHECDFVLLLNNNSSFDMIYQMMFRSMTENINKKCGFVVDLNLYRVIETSIIEYASIIKPELHPKEAIKYILEEKLISLNADHWMSHFTNQNNQNNKIEILSKNIYEIYSSNTKNALDYFLNRLKFKSISLSNEEQKMFNKIFYITKTKNERENKEQKEENEEEIKQGIERTEIDTNENNKEKEEEIKVNYMDILKHIIPLVCILTINRQETFFIDMCFIIKEDNYLFNILIDQLKSWWGKLIDSKIINILIDIYSSKIKDDKEINQIIRSIKELFMNNINNPIQLSNLIDKYLLPQELEKINNAEISTPHQLRIEMLDKIPTDFWTHKNKVFEPCSGKGGFLIDIINKFMIGLKDQIKDENERYKVIVEECLYFSDINPTNIFICKLILDPNNRYKLNYNKGDTLELDIKTKWNIEKFDAVIGNPPYNSSGNIGSGNTVWQMFVKNSLDKWISKNGYLVFVHPPGWRKPNTEKGKFYGLFELMTIQNQMIYLEIHGIKDGQKTFNCGTRYDWYLVQKKEIYKNTIIVDEDARHYEINLKEITWLPNSNILEINKILAKDKDEKCRIIQSMSSYEPRKKWMSSIETQEFKYPCVHSTPKSGVRYMYSKLNDKGHFGISKVIFGDSGIYKPIIDMEGKFGMTQHAMGIQVEDIQEAIAIAQVIQSENFNKILKSCLFSSYAIDWNIFKEFKKDFWKEFI